MFLADAVAAYIESLTERELDAPLFALLSRLGFDKVHLVHGAYEFGKDFVAQRTEGEVRYQYCLQSKAGDLGAAGWRAVRQQVDAMRTGTVAHPDFDPCLERRLVVVTNGRLTGSAPVEAQDYNAYHRNRDEAVAEFWDADVLVPHFEEILVEGVPAQDRARTLELLGRLGQGMGTRQDIRAYAQPWFAAGLDPSQRWGHVLTGSMLAKHAADQGREDLAAQIAFRLLRASWERPEPVDPTETIVARRLFETHADQVWRQVKAQDPVAVTLRSRTGLDAFVLHPVKAARLCECLGLLALLSLEGPDAGRADDIGDYLSDFVAASPAAAHLVSDDAAFSVLAATLALAATGRSASAELYLRQVAVWVLDLVEHGAGLADSGEPAPAAVRRLLGPAYPSLAPPGREPAAYALAVVLDLAHVLGFHGLYRDLVHDLEAVEAFAKIVAPDDEGGHRLIARLDYRPDPSPVPADHHTVPASGTPAGREGQWFDCIASWATYRDRHVGAVLHALLERAATTTTAGGPTTRVDDRSGSDTAMTSKCFQLDTIQDSWAAGRFKNLSACGYHFAAQQHLRATEPEAAAPPILTGGAPASAQTNVKTFDEASVSRQIGGLGHPGPSVIRFRGLRVGDPGLCQSAAGSGGPSVSTSPRTT